MPKGYDDPKPEQKHYSFDYLQELRRNDPELLVELYRDGCFDRAIAERNQEKSEKRVHVRRKAAGPSEMKAWNENSEPSDN